MSEETKVVKAKKKSSNLYIIVMCILICLIVIAFTINAVIDYYAKDIRSKLLPAYYQQAGEYLSDCSEDIISYAVTDGYTIIVVDDTWYNSTQKEREDFCHDIQDSITVIRNECNLNDGLFETIIIHDDNSKQIAIAGSDGAVDIED